MNRITGFLVFSSWMVWSGCTEQNLASLENVTDGDVLYDDGGFKLNNDATRDAINNNFRDGSAIASDSEPSLSEAGVIKNPDATIINNRDATSDKFICTPQAFLGCSSSNIMLRCNAYGTGTVTINCSPYLCDSANQRCAQCDPKTAPVCQGNDLLSCTSDGLIQKVTCPNGCLNGACINCVVKAFYQDKDLDGYGDPKAKVESCAQPANYVANDLDCDDLDPAAHPGQNAFFNVPTNGTKNFDYNCSKVEEQEFPSLVNCVLSSGTNCIGDGWINQIPSCGQTGMWAKCNKQGGNPPGCGLTSASRIQGCH